MTGRTLHACALAMLCALGTSIAAGAPSSSNLVFVYIHGFGGEKESPQFCANMESFLEQTAAPARVENYVWNSVSIKPLQAGASWRESEQRADQEASGYASTVIDRYEASQTPYVLVGFSLGSRVILEALKTRQGPLDSLQGVYFLGSAMPRDSTLSTNALPDGMKIINYHSPQRDKVHRMAFSFMNEKAAGGEVGFDDTSLFDNYAVSCTHTHKGVGVHIDYSQLAIPIGYIALFKQGVRLPGRLSLNLATEVGDGDLWWNKVLRVSALINAQRVPVMIEQNNMNADYFRALRIRPDGSRERIARGKNLHALLKHLKVDGERDILESESF